METRTRLAACAVALAALLAASPPAPAAKRISGKLSKPGYTIIALNATGRADSARVPRGKFSLKAPGDTVTLHLRARGGKYAGPVVVGKRRGGRRAIVGVLAGAKLGRISVRKGFARARPPRKWRDARRYARAKRGIPIGARRFGHVKSRKAHGGVPGDRDLDGIPNPLDIDDDGDRVLDNLDHSRRAGASQFHASGAFLLGPTFMGDLPQTANANAPGLSDAQVEAALPTFGVLGIEILPGDSAELDCGTPQSRTDPTLGGLVYCSSGGTGRVIDYRQPESSWPPFPECCDTDSDGFGTLPPNPTLPPPDRGMFLHHGASSTQIGTGDVLIQRVMTSGTETEFLATLQYVFATTPALVSYDDGGGNSATLAYPVAQNGPGTRQNPFPVAAGPNGDVVVTLTFWRPQRRPIPPETGDWIDIGGLNYRASLADIDPGEFTCEQNAYSTSDPNLTPTDPTTEPGGGGFRDLSGNQSASPNNTFSYQLNLTECLSSKGFSFNPGETRGFQLTAVTPQLNANDTAGVSVFFRR